jgi:hypothetical protein
MKLGAALALLFLGGCSTVMEANRPVPVSLNQYRVGEPRMDVISTLGAPEGTVQDGGNSCDVYKLYTKGDNSGQKAAVILGEAGADLLTLGLFEVVATPVQGATKSHLHTVLVCYSPQGTLISMRDEGSYLRGSASESAAAAGSQGMTQPAPATASAPAPMVQAAAATPPASAPTATQASTATASQSQKCGVIQKDDGVQLVPCKAANSALR